MKTIVNKKTVLAAGMFLFLLIAVPLIQPLLFAQNKSGTIVVNQPIDAPYLQSADKEFVLMFFGYVGCTKICTPILHQLDNFYDSEPFAPLKPSVGFTFVNLMPEVEPEQPEAFAKSFNPEFKGVYLKQKELMRIDREFSLFFSKSLANPGEIDHSDHLYLIERQKNGKLILKNIYTTHPLHKEAIIADIQEYRKGQK